ncbi:MAG: hypothetical protein JXA73_22210 [Acidobacteria bacterium]|nr:hypothetical protein [Acidobacteriota bacterium]
MRIMRLLCPFIVFCILNGNQLFAQQATMLEGRALYEALKKFELQGKASVSNLKLKRDRAEMAFTGDFYFAAPVNGRVPGAVFIGEGTFRAEPPDSAFEKENVRRFLRAEVVESDFRAAVLRFSDDTFDIIGKGKDAGAAIPSDALKLASELEPRLLKETGINVSARLLVSMVNSESPGIFLAQFDKGSRNRFTYLVDPQTRIPGSMFGINAGEKVVLFSYSQNNYENDLWIVAPSEEDFKTGRVLFSDAFDMVSPLHYKMGIDLRQPRTELRTQMRIDFESSINNLSALSMMVNEDLSEYDNIRLKDAMRLKSAGYGGQDLPFIQEDWEIGLTLLLPKPLQKGEKFSVDLALDGDFIDDQRVIQEGYYPQSNTCWYPRHGFLTRSTYEMVFRHNKNHQVSSVGKLIRESEWPDAKNERLTEFRIDKPVAMVTFAAGSIERHTEMRKLSIGEVPIEFYSLPGTFARIKESFILAELGNALDYFCVLFGRYPYENFKATFHPFRYGQGFPTLLLIPNTDESRREVYAFISHETAHQWWGHIVSWRSYRDQWLSEGFAEYSGILYTQLRDKSNSYKELIRDARLTLIEPPITGTGVGSGKISEIGPLILGRRLRTRNTLNGYNNLIYYKGALVLRMLHYLFCDPSTGNGQPFYDMMSDFVKRFENKAASTEDFADVASAHFARTPLARHLGLKDLNWFFRQWIFEAKLPSYKMEYRLEPGQNGQFVFKGTVFQENAGPDWFMPLPIILSFPGNQQARSVVYVNGAQTPFQMNLPMKPSSVELDPDHWILSEKTSTRKQ